MSPARSLQRRQAQSRERTGGGIHSHLRIEHALGSIPGDFIQPRALRPWSLHEAIDATFRPSGFFVGHRAGVIQNDLEPPPIQMSHDSSQRDVPYRVLPYLAAHNSDANALSR